MTSDNERVITCDPVPVRFDTLPLILRENPITHSDHDNSFVIRATNPPPENFPTCICMLESSHIEERGVDDWWLPFGFHQERSSKKHPDFWFPFLGAARSSTVKFLRILDRRKMKRIESGVRGARGVRSRGVS